MAKNVDEINVLLVDDVSQARRFVEVILSGMGVHQVFTANDGRSALDFLSVELEMVDLIICDWQMPRMSGIELLKQVRVTMPDMPFMMVTGRSDIKSVTESRDFGVNAYIAKPFSPQDFEKKIKALLRYM
ncbi:MAG: response regulator [Alphaproteobacteria bacterium]|jgi:two-component system chemotaxis response regulator CheY